MHTNRQIHTHEGMSALFELTHIHIHSHRHPCAFIISHIIIYTLYLSAVVVVAAASGLQYIKLLTFVVSNLGQCIPLRTSPSATQKIRSFRIELNIN